MIECKECGFKGKNLTTHIIYKHKMSPEEYRKKHGNQKMRYVWNIGLKGIQKSHRKGKSLEEEYGVEKAKEIKMKLSSSHKGQRTSLGRRLSYEQKTKISNTLKEKYKNSEIKVVGSYSKEYINSPEGRLQRRLLRIRQIEKQKSNGLPIHPTIGRNETTILDKIEEEKNIKIIRQYKILGYFLDGYDKENNIVYEVDEEHHFDEEGNLNQRDIRRQYEIVGYLGCQFVRVKDVA